MSPYFDFIVFLMYKDFHRKLFRLFYTEKSIEKILKLFASGGVSELSQSLGLYLPYSFSCDLKALTYFFKSTGPAVVKTEA